MNIDVRPHYDWCNDVEMNFHLMDKLDDLVELLTPYHSLYYTTSSGVYDVKIINSKPVWLKRE